MKKLFATLCLSLSFAGAAMADTYIGYTNTNFDRMAGVRFGSSETQGQAIRLTKDKLDLLRGKQIKGVRAVFGTRNMENLTFFVTTELGGTPAYEQQASGGTYQWRDFSFSTPYTVGDEDELYVGYTLRASTSYSPLLFDEATGVVGHSYHYTSSGWQDSYSQNLGNANLQLIIDGDMDFTDITVKDFSTVGYFLADSAYTYTGEILNFGTQPITSFDVEFRVGDDAPRTYSFTGLNIAAHQTYSFDLAEYAASQQGDLPIEMAVTNINGGAADADLADNSVSNTIFMYPADMRRAVLLEGFTGQSCGNCPGGHRYINNALEMFDGDVVEVFHHIGYYPDNFTMSEESFYINFYGGSTYAPAFMVNRMLGNGSSTVVQNVSVGAVLNMLKAAAAEQPYFAVEINTDYDEATRLVTGSVDVMPYVMPDADTIMLSLFVVQDSIIATQSGGSNNYVHRYAYRGSLFNQIGVRISPERYQWLSTPVNYELPDSIFSTYYEGQTEKLPSILTDPDQMYLVAIVSKYYVGSDGTLDCPVYNVDMVKMCTDNATVSGISDVAGGEAAADIRVSGNRVSVSGRVSTISVYDMSGRMVQSFDGSTTEFTLPKGLYIVRAGGEGGTTSRKVAVM